MKNKNFSLSRQVYHRHSAPCVQIPNAYGDQCENAAFPRRNNWSTQEALSDAVPVKKKQKNWYFPLQHYEAWLKEWIIDGHKEWKNNVIWPM